MPRRRRRAPSALWMLVASLVLAALITASCAGTKTSGAGSAGPSSSGLVSTTSSTDTSLDASPSGSSTSSSRPIPWAAPSAEVTAAFQQLRARLPGLRLYLPERLPAGTSVARTWWPVSSGKSPTFWTGPALANPRLTGAGNDPQVSIVLQVGDGDAWLEVLERIKGDLGDVPSRPTDDVSGRPASAYRLHGGDLIQWSDGGSWFGVYGRHLAEGVTAGVAASMRPTEG